MTDRSVFVAEGARKAFVEQAAPCFRLFMEQFSESQMFYSYIDELSASEDHSY